MKSHVQVLKFGGTSVGNGERIRRVAYIVVDTFKEPEEAFPVVVVSAMAKVTDQLLRIATQSYAGEQEACQSEFIALKQKHNEAAEKVVRSLPERAKLYQKLETAFTALEADIAALANAQGSSFADVQLRTAAVGAWGERLSVLLVAAAIADIRSRKRKMSRQQV